MGRGSALPSRNYRRERAVSQRNPSVKIMVHIMLMIADPAFGRRSPLTLCFEDTILLSPQILLLLNEVKITRPELGFDRGENRREQDSLEHLWLVAINCLDPVHELLSFREP